MCVERPEMPVHISLLSSTRVVRIKSTQFPQCKGVRSSGVGRRTSELCVCGAVDMETVMRDHCQALLVQKRLHAIDLVAHDGQHVIPPEPTKRHKLSHKASSQEE